MPNQMQRTTLKDVLKKAVPQDLFGPVDGRQRLALQWTGALLGAGLAATFVFGGVLWGIADFGFFGVVADFSLLPFMLLRTPVGVLLLVGALIAWFAMAWYTDGFVRGKLEWLQAGNALVAVGTVTAVALTLPLLNFLLSAAIVLLVLGVIAAIFLG